MCSFLAPSREWSEYNFGEAKLGDQRRTARLVKVADRLAAHPSGTMPQAMESWPDTKGAYRFFSQAEASYERIIAPHLAHTRAACERPGEYLIIEDTTCLDFTQHPAALELGYIGNGKGRGFELHSALAVRVEGWTRAHRPRGQLVGLWGQQCDRPQPRPPGETEAQRWQRPRKSQRWAAAFKGASSPPRDCRWIFVADREADFYEPMRICKPLGIDFVIRANHDRRLEGEAGHLWETVAGAPVLGHMTVELRAREGEPARTATVELRHVGVALSGPWRVGGWQPALRGVNVVEVREVGAPAGTPRPLHWVLLTSLPCQSLKAVRRVGGRYAARWWIEEYHKALKSGVGIEQSQLETRARLEALIGVLAVVALRLLATKLLARSCPEGTAAVESFGPEALAILEKKFGRPQEGWTNQSVLETTARLGGFLARKGDGPPGWQTIWRGWKRLLWMCEGVAALIPPPKRCG